MKNNKKGFTIVELVIVIAVIAILAAVLIPTFSSVIEKSKKSAASQKANNALQIVITDTVSSTDASVAAAKYGFLVDGYWFEADLASGASAKLNDGKKATKDGDDFKPESGFGDATLSTEAKADLSKIKVDVYVQGSTGGDDEGGEGGV